MKVPVLGTVDKAIQSSSYYFSGALQSTLLETYMYGLLDYGGVSVTVLFTVRAPCRVRSHLCTSEETARVQAFAVLHDEARSTVSDCPPWLTQAPNSGPHPPRARICKALKTDGGFCVVGVIGLLNEGPPAYFSVGPLIRSVSR